MTPRRPDAKSVAQTWELARSGDLRGAAEAARRGLGCIDVKPAQEVELRLVAASCAMRQGLHADALRELEAAAHAAKIPQAGADAAMRVEAWRAELAYFQGRYSAAEETIGVLLPQLERRRDWGYAAFVSRIRIAILLARTEYDAIENVAPAALRHADASGDPYVIVQVLNILGAARFDRATSKLPQPHARSHLSALDPGDTAPMESDAREALRFFERAKEVAEQGGYEFAAWYVSGNIERLQILLGRAGTAARQIRKRLKVLQSKGAKYDEIVTRSNLAWALRTLGRHAEALHELDVALDLARETGTFNVLLEFLYYDRSIVLEALGEHADARASYRRYLRLAAGGRGTRASGAAPASGSAKRPLEPYFLKRADQFIVEQIGSPFSIAGLARHCGVSWRTLQKAFMDFRGVTPVTHARNVRLDHAHRALEEGGGVADVAARFGFGSPTTFSLEYRKRFGRPPSRTKIGAGHK